MLVGTRCWGAGDDDHWDVILNERRDLLAALLGAGDRWMRYLNAGRRERSQERDVEGMRGPVGHSLEAGGCMKNPLVALWEPVHERRQSPFGSRLGA